MGQVRFVEERAHMAAAHAFEHLGQIAAGNAERLQRNRALFNDFVAVHDRLECMRADHGIVAFPKWLGGDSDRLDSLLRARYDTSIVPGRWFDKPDHFRVGLGGDTMILEEGLARIGAAMDELE